MNETFIESETVTLANVMFSGTSDHTGSLDPERTRGAG